MSALTDFEFQGHVEARWTEMEIALVHLQMFKRLRKILCELWDQVYFILILRSAIKTHSRTYRPDLDRISVLFRL
jgi:hypothetical protein